MGSACTCLLATKDDPVQSITTNRTNAVKYQASPRATVEKQKNQTPKNSIGTFFNIIIHGISTIFISS